MKSQCFFKKKNLVRVEEDQNQKLLPNQEKNTIIFTYIYIYLVICFYKLLTDK